MRLQPHGEQITATIRHYAERGVMTIRNYADTAAWRTSHSDDNASLCGTSYNNFASLFGFSMMGSELWWIVCYCAEQAIMIIRHYAENE